MATTISTNAGVLPTYTPNSEVTAVVYGKNDSGSMAMSMEAFFSDGAYCLVVAGVGAMGVLSGKWQQTGNDIKITLDRNIAIFGVWESKNTQTPTVLISDWLISNFAEPFLIGFGTNTPTKLQTYDPKKGESTLAIPKGATHFFVGRYNKGTSKQTLTRLSLDTKGFPSLDKGENFQLQAIAYPNIYAALPNDFAPEYKIQNGQLLGRMVVFKEINEPFEPLTGGEKISGADKITALKQQCTLDPSGKDDRYAYAKKDVIEWQGRID